LPIHAAGGGAAWRPATIHLLESAGSITSSIPRMLRRGDATKAMPIFEFYSIPISSFPGEPYRSAEQPENSEMNQSSFPTAGISVPCGRLIPSEDPRNSPQDSVRRHANCARARPSRDHPEGRGSISPPRPPYVFRLFGRGPDGGAGDGGDYTRSWRRAVVTEFVDGIPLDKRRDDERQDEIRVVDMRHHQSPATATAAGAGR
jgi:hypothetical protein